ncbi:choice-of-anchor G family protein [Corynebacterium glutamicum]|uniref:Uncharacterized protein n=1 Tax=Corynebacterium glutamicum (strain R) TaxID=340322 RepID=A0AB72VDX0_CORGB|nr:choice-of-anchor G family protein [Corynebacterium glutamicum]BAF55713.1 hypothetical protein cgR_2697 [Corynebacterium glutamicum R]
MKIKKSASALSRSMRIGIATITSTAMLGGVLVAVPAHPLLPTTAVAQAQTVTNSAPIAMASGQVIDLALFENRVNPADKAKFLSALEAIRADAEYPGTPTETSKLDLTLLQGINLQLGTLNVPLLSLVKIEGNAGVLGASAAATTGDTASAAAGVLSDNGSINLGAHGSNSGVDTVLDLTDVLGNAGVDAITDGIIDELSLRIGAVSASAQRDGDQVTSEYALSNVDLTLNSPLVEGLVETLVGEDTANPGLGVQIDKLVDDVAGDSSVLSGVTGLLDGVLGILGDANNVDVELSTNIQGALKPLLAETLVSDAVSIDLASGQIRVNLEKLGGTSVVNPNTNLLNEAAVKKIENEVQTLLNQLLAKVRTAVEDGILATAVNVDLNVGLLGARLASVKLEGSLAQFLDGTADINVTLLGSINLSSLTNALKRVLAGVGEALEVAIDKVVDPLLNNVLDNVVSGTVAPLVGGIGELLADADILSITLNDQPNPLTGTLTNTAGRPNAKTGAIARPDEEFTVSALRINVLDGLIDLPLARATVNADADWTAPVGGPTIGKINDQSIDLGEEIESVTPKATPTDAKITVEGLPKGVEFKDGVISGEPEEAGTFPITVTVTDSADRTAKTTFTITVTDTSTPAVKPTIEAIGDQEIELGDPIDDVTPVVTPEGAEVSITGQPAGVTIVDGVISGTPTRAGNFNVTVTATNEGLTASTSFKITVTDPDSDVVAPTIAPIADAEGTEEKPITPIEVVVTPEEAVVDVDGLPKGVEYDSETGEISGTPEKGTEGSHQVTVTATNDGGDATETFTFVVKKDNNGGGDNGSGDNGSSDNGSSGSSDGTSNGSSDFLQQCLDSPAAGVAGLLVALGTVGAIAGPALEPLMKSIGAELDRALRNLTNASSGANQPEWVRNINRGLNDAANAVDHRMVSQALFATAALALISTPVLCGMDNSSSSSS